MKVHKYLFYSLVFFWIGFTTKAQSIDRQVIGSAGETIADGATISIDFTVGEVAITTITDGVAIISQGFHQGDVRVEIKINPRVLLQGPLLGSSANQMLDDLRVAGYLPTSSPYADGLTCDLAVFNDGGLNGTGNTSDNIIDWIWVELRDKNDSTNIIAGQSALIQKDGDIVSVDGISNLVFDVNSDQYYILINHRNHLGILTANTVSLSGTTTQLDFSTNPLLLVGGENAVYDFGTGYYAMYAGDYDNNGQVQNSDLNEVLNYLGLANYSSADLNMNGQVQNSDINLILEVNKGKGTQY